MTEISKRNILKRWERMSKVSGEAANIYGIFTKLFQQNEEGIRIRWDLEEQKVFNGYKANDQIIDGYTLISFKMDINVVDMRDCEIENLDDYLMHKCHTKYGTRYIDIWSQAKDV